MLGQVSLSCCWSISYPIQASNSLAIKESYLEMLRSASFPVEESQASKYCLLAPRSPSPFKIQSTAVTSCDPCQDWRLLFLLFPMPNSDCSLPVPYPSAASVGLLGTYFSLFNESGFLIVIIESLSIQLELAVNAFLFHSSLFGSKF